MTRPIPVKSLTSFLRMKGFDFSVGSATDIGLPRTSLAMRQTIDHCSLKISQGDLKLLIFCTLRCKIFIFIFCFRSTNKISKRRGMANIFPLTIKKSSISLLLLFMSVNKTIFLHSVVECKNG